MTHSLNHGDTETQRKSNFFAFFASSWLSRITSLVSSSFLPRHRFLLSSFPHPRSYIQPKYPNTCKLSNRISRFTLYLLPSHPLHPPHTPPRTSLRLPLRPLRLPWQIPPACPHRCPLYASNRCCRCLLQRPPRSTWTTFHFLILSPFNLIPLSSSSSSPTSSTTPPSSSASSATPFPALTQNSKQTARSLGADSFHVWTNIILPLLRPSIFAASLLVFLFDFTSFGVILLLGGSQFSTLEVEIYLQAVKLLNLPLAALLSVIQLLCTLAFSILYTRLVTRATQQLNPRSTTTKPKNIKQKLFVFTFCSLLTVYFALPLASLPIRSLFRLEADRGQRGEVQYGFTTDYYNELFVNRRGSSFMFRPSKQHSTRLPTPLQPSSFPSFSVFLPHSPSLNRPTSKKSLTRLSCSHLVRPQSCLGLDLSSRMASGLPHRSLFHLHIRLLHCPLSFAHCNLPSHPFRNGFVMPHPPSAHHHLKSGKT